MFLRLIGAHVLFVQRNWIIFNKFVCCWRFFFLSFSSPFYSIHSMDHEKRRCVHLSLSNRITFVSALFKLHSWTMWRSVPKLYRIKAKPKYEKMSFFSVFPIPLFLSNINDIRCNHSSSFYSEKRIILVLYVSFAYSEYPHCKWFVSKLHLIV